MEISESRCSELLDNNKIFSAHLIMKIIRGDFVLGKNDIDHWIELLKDDDLYLIYRFFQDSENASFLIPNKEDLIDICSIFFYIQNNREGNEKEINILFIEFAKKIEKEAEIRGLLNKTIE